ncbi:MAG: protein-ADP-ribose hydrolase [Bacteroidales bacterium]|nr:protein-ADP-ribose hydrolase [Bacteroidales bacterium]
MDRLENLKNIIMYLMADEHVSHQIPASLEERQRMMRALMNVWKPRPISEDFLKMQDAELQMQREDKGMVKLDAVAAANSKLSSLNSQLCLWQGDITRLKVDAIVNAANAQALGCWAPLHNCIDNCIHSAAGIQLRKECADKMQGRMLATGDAFITQGYNLPARYVIHTVGPIIPDGVPTRQQEKQLAQCYHSCLDLAEQNGLESIAFCCISTGVFHFPNELAAKIAIKTVKSYPKHALKTIVFNVFLDKDRDIYQQLL